ncbi:hypothetical protein DFH08DRAFT_806157 [Mycena albidolilacea]|uniref:Uncharacterized protein n=1 Tax=Mycena albidolilacea TaxID=1033008 RepID=A0AAD7A8J7_9AGAR|nr:hypothetical protein DFH08DRAFT_806157 [Mycena albidolilacea]
MPAEFIFGFLTYWAWSDFTSWNSTWHHTQAAVGTTTAREQVCFNILEVASNEPAVRLGHRTDICFMHESAVSCQIGPIGNGLHGQDGLGPPISGLWQIEVTGGVDPSPGAQRPFFF